MPVTVAFYEGGGFSETRENRKRSALEHRVITRFYQGFWKRSFYSFLMLATLAPLRTKIAESLRCQRAIMRLNLRSTGGKKDEGRK